MNDNPLPFILVIVAISVAILFGFSAYSSNSSAASGKQSVSIIVEQQDRTYGKKDAKVVLVEYLDFECEACAAAFPMVQKIKEEYKDRILFVTRYFPLSGHKSSRVAAYAVEAAGRQGKYWEMHDIVFQKQTEWSNSQDPKGTLQSYALSLGLNMEEYKSYTISAETQNRIQRDLDSGNKAGVEGTPTFFLNGRKIITPNNISEFKKKLDDELSFVSSN